MLETLQRWWKFRKLTKLKAIPCPSLNQIAEIDRLAQEIADSILRKINSL